EPPADCPGLSMARVGAVFIAACMVLIAGSLGVVAHLAFGFSSTQAAILAFAALTGLALFNAMTTRSRAPSARAITDLSNATADRAKRVGELTERIDSAEAAAKRARTASEVTAGEIGALEARITDLVDTVNVHDAALFGAGLAGPAARREAAAATAAPEPKA